MKAERHIVAMLKQEVWNTETTSVCTCTVELAFPGGFQPVLEMKRRLRDWLHDRHDRTNTVHPVPRYG